MPFIPSMSCKVLDIGSGSGRDAAVLSDMGHSVTAVEPCYALLRSAKGTYSSYNILIEKVTPRANFYP